MKKFLNAHYEKIILAVLLIAFAALLYYQLLFVQKAQNQDVDIIVDQKQPDTDYERIDIDTKKEYKMETIFSEWNKVEPDEVSATANQNLPPGAPQPAANDPAAANQQNQAVTPVPARVEYELSDPHHPDYGKTLIGETRDEIKCTIVVNYLFYRADNITPQ